MHDNYNKTAHWTTDSYDNFIAKFDLANKSDGELALIAAYFSFTSLSTVGLGDYHPRSDGERIIAAFMLLFGVAIFSYIMGHFIDILNQF